MKLPQRGETALLERCGAARQRWVEAVFFALCAGCATDPAARSDHGLSVVIGAAPERASADLDCSIRNREGGGLALDLEIRSVCATKRGVELEVEPAHQASFTVTLRVALKQSQEDEPDRISLNAFPTYRAGTVVRATARATCLDHSEVWGSARCIVPKLDQ